MHTVSFGEKTGTQFASKGKLPHSQGAAESLHSVAAARLDFKSSLSSLRGNSF